MSKEPICSVLIEWENALAAADERPGQVLRELATQARTELSAKGYAELIVIYDPARVEEGPLRDLVAKSIESSNDSLMWKLLPADGLHYYEMKNLGVQAASSNYVIFLDSDVIPDPQWLQKITTAMSDPQYQVVASSAYVDVEGFLDKVMALVWVFDPLPLSDKIIRIGNFKANSVAMRRSILLEHPFPNIPGRSRGSEYLLGMELRRTGIPIWQHLGARVRHPRPVGREIIVKAIAEGRDRHLNSMQHGAIYYAATRFLRGVNRIFLFRSRVGLPAWQIPAALVVTMVYYSFNLAGALAAMLAPQYMKRHFLP